MSLDTLQQHSSWGTFVLRLLTGVVFLVAGWSKVTGIEGITGLLAGIGFPIPAVFAWIVAVAELLGGIALILGAFTQLAAIPLVVIMLVASILKITGILGEAGFASARLDLMLFAATLVFALGATSALTLKE